MSAASATRSWASIAATLGAPCSLTPVIGNVMLLRPSAPQAVTATVKAAPGSQLHVTVADPSASADRTIGRCRNGDVRRMASPGMAPRSVPAVRSEASHSTGSALGRYRSCRAGLAGGAGTVAGVGVCRGGVRSAGGSGVAVGGGPGGAAAAGPDDGAPVDRTGSAGVLVAVRARVVGPPGARRARSLAPAGRGGPGLSWGRGRRLRRTLVLVAGRARHARGARGRIVLWAVEHRHDEAQEQGAQRDGQGQHGPDGDAEPPDHGAPPRRAPSDSHA